MSLFHKNSHNSLNNWPIFNSKPPLESWQSRLSDYEVTYSPANAPACLLRRILYVSFFTNLMKKLGSTKH